MDIEKVFDSFDHNFLISALEKHGFGKSFFIMGKYFIKKSGIMYS